MNIVHKQGGGGKLNEISFGERWWWWCNHILTNIKAFLNKTKERSQQTLIIMNTNNYYIVVSNPLSTNWEYIL